jgi:ankyrin repeat protein
MRAAAYGDANMVEILIKRNPFIDHLSENANTALMLAAKSGIL